MAEHFHIAKSTVRNHLWSARIRYNAVDTTHLIAMLLREGILR